MTVLERIRTVIFFTPWVSIPLSLLGILLAVALPLIGLGSLGWAVYALSVLVAVGLGAWLRPRYRLAILDSSPLGVVYWLQRRG